MLTHVRVGRRAIPIQARLRLLDALGYVINRELLLRVLPEDHRAAIIDTNAALPEAHYKSHEPGVDVPLELPPVWR